MKKEEKDSQDTSLVIDIKEIEKILINKFELNFFSYIVKIINLSEKIFNTSSEFSLNDKDYISQKHQIKTIINKIITIINKIITIVFTSEDKRTLMYDSCFEEMIFAEINNHLNKKNTQIKIKINNKSQYIKE